MEFSRYICVMAALAEMPTGGSAGHVARRAGGYGCILSKGQTERVLKKLESEGYVTSERVKYRTGIDRILYHVTKQTVVAIIHLNDSFNSMEIQLALEPIGK